MCHLSLLLGPTFKECTWLYATLTLKPLAYITPEAAWLGYLVEVDRFISSTPCKINVRLAILHVINLASENTYEKLI